MLLKILFKNLAKNAYLHNDKDSIQIEVHHQTQDNSILFNDNGPGIALDHEKNAFDEFVRDDRKNSRGTGLGLAICKRIMLAHKGYN